MTAEKRQQSQQLGRAELDEATKVMELEPEILALKEKVKRLELALSRCEEVMDDPMRRASLVQETRGPLGLSMKPVQRIDRCCE